MINTLTTSVASLFCHVLPSYLVFYIIKTKKKRQIKCFLKNLTNFKISPFNLNFMVNCFFDTTKLFICFFLHLFSM